MSYIELKNLSKVYPNGYEAVKDVSISIDENDFLILLGPSGCGKTTILRMIAGLEEVSSGEMKIDGKVINNLSPKDRNLSMVFQNYALYPHMSVFGNMAFGLKLRKLPKEEINKRINEAAKMLELESQLEKKPKQLSGGQRQRVALGRAIVSQNDICLFDEPLSNLDAKLRNSTRHEILTLHSTLNSTFIYVTHDQVEAMTMGTKVALLDKGYIQQFGSPLDLYNKPANIFVAGFLGAPPINLFKCAVKVDKDNIRVSAGDYINVDLPADDKKYSLLKAYDGKEIIIGIRSEDIIPEERKTAQINIIVDRTETLGPENFIYANLPSNESLSFKVHPDTIVARDENLAITCKRHKIKFFDIETEKNIIYNS